MPQPIADRPAADCRPIPIGLHAQVCELIRTLDGEIGLTAYVRGVDVAGVLLVVLV